MVGQRHTSGDGDGVLGPEGPSRPLGPETPGPLGPGPPRGIRGVITRSPWASALFAIAVTAPAGVVIAVLATVAAASYGWALFVGTPFAIGVCAAAVHRVHHPKRVAASLAVGLMAVGTVAVALLAAGVEGAICIVMALPLAAAAAVCGGLLDHFARARARARSGIRFQASLLFVLLPLLTAGEASLDREPAVRPVTTSVVIDAPPDVVWDRVVSFPRLPPPREAIFRAGIAYPIEATIEGRGPGAIRRCRFSTGDFVEPITVWKEERLLRFSVTSQPEPLKELSPWGDVQPPHVDAYLKSHQGQFRLTPLPGGRTRLEGTTWYENRMWPERYWRAWSDELIHAIHRRVLRHIEGLAEADATLP